MSIHQNPTVFISHSSLELQRPSVSGLTARAQLLTWYNQIELSIARRFPSKLSILSILASVSAVCIVAGNGSLSPLQPRFGDAGTYWTGRATGFSSDHKPLTPILPHSVHHTEEQYVL